MANNHHVTLCAFLLASIFCLSQAKLLNPVAEIKQVPGSLDHCQCSIMPPLPLDGPPAVCICSTGPTVSLLWFCMLVLLPSIPDLLHSMRPRLLLPECSDKLFAPES